GRRGARARARTDSSHCRGTGHGRAGAESRGDAAHDGRRGGAPDRARRDAPVRGAGQARCRHGSHERMVCAASRRRRSREELMTWQARFRDRADAGRQLAADLREYAGRDDVIVLGLPRGGIPVAYEVARALDVPLDIFLVRKLGVPGHEEYAMGAIASGGVRVVNEDVTRELGIGEEVISRVAAQEQIELERREREYRRDRPEPELRGRTVILVDDGL